MKTYVLNPDNTLRRVDDLTPCSHDGNVVGMSDAAKTSYRYVVQSRHVEDSETWWVDQAGPWHPTADAAFKAIDATRKPKTRVYRVIKRTVTEEVVERGEIA